MSDHFHGARRKIGRANKHIAELDTLILSLEETATVQQNRETGNQELVHALPEFMTVADDISLIAGDVIHNLKTALDFAWISLLRREVPGANLDRAKFPVYPTRRELEAALNGIPINAAVHPAIFNLIVADVQPFSGGKNEVVYTLHRLDIADKHLLLPGLVPLAGIKGIVVQRQDGEIIRRFWWYDPEFSTLRDPVR